jgi:3-deoxy-7-phosphoheptulonate synthase
MNQIVNTRIQEFIKLISPLEIRSEIPVSDKATSTIMNGREDFRKILSGEDGRLAVIVGPCSIHDPKGALEYAEKLKGLHDKLGDKLFIMMRVYFEKPRTTVGWKGMINDPYLNETFDMVTGLKMARRLLIDINELGVPTATELLDPIVSAYTAELVSWVAIGARTTESQTHRQMASGLSAPVGFKNNSDGNLDVAVNAMQSAKNGHNFLGIDDEGNSCVLKTKGNSDVHIVLRGGKGRPNYHTEDIENCEGKLQAADFDPRILIDCSHENSGKNPAKQKIVIKDVIAQKQMGNKSIFGVMLEGNLFEGNQKIPENLADLKYGVSVTDACIGWEETEGLLAELYESL